MEAHLESNKDDPARGGDGEVITNNYDRSISG